MTNYSSGEGTCSNGTFEYFTTDFPHNISPGIGKKKHIIKKGISGSKGSLNINIFFGRLDQPKIFSW